MYIGGWGGESNREIDFGFVFRVRDRVVRCEAVRDDIWYARGSGTFFSSSALLWPARVVHRSRGQLQVENNEKHMVV